MSHERKSFPFHIITTLPLADYFLGTFRDVFLAHMQIYLIGGCEFRFPIGEIDGQIIFSDVIVTSTYTWQSPHSQTNGVERSRLIFGRGLISSIFFSTIPIVVAVVVVTWVIAADPTDFITVEVRGGLLLTVDVCRIGLCTCVTTTCCPWGVTTTFWWWVAVLAGAGCCCRIIIVLVPVPCCCGVCATNTVWGWPWTIAVCDCATT